MRAEVVENRAKQGGCFSIGHGGRPQRKAPHPNAGPSRPTLNMLMAPQKSERARPARTGSRNGRYNYRGLRAAMAQGPASMARKRQKDKTGPARLWPLLAVNFFMADMQSGIGPFVGVFLLERGWASGMIGTALAVGNIAGMFVTTPVGGFIDASRRKRAWVIVPGVAMVAASSIILISQDFWAVTASQVATSVAGAAIVPAVTGITLGMVGQKGFNRQNGRNQAFNHAGNMAGAAAAGLFGAYYGLPAVFILATAFGAFTIGSILLIPGAAIDHRAARGQALPEDAKPIRTFRVLYECKPLLILSAALALFHLGNAAMLPLYGLAISAAHQDDAAELVALTIVVAQGVMIGASLVAMRMAEASGYWLVILISFIALPIRAIVASMFITEWGVFPV